MRKILVVANETIESEELFQVVRGRAAGAEVLLVAPALCSRLKLWCSDIDDAREAAEDRLARALGRLLRAGVRARGVVGDSDPLQAIGDALHGFHADELVIATHPRRRSSWLERRLVERAQARHRLPVVHVAAGERELAAAA